MLKPISYDVIIFNFGMHDVNCEGDKPEQYTPIFAYSMNLRLIKKRLLSTGAKIGFVLTTPAPWNSSVNDKVKQYNRAAQRIMGEEPAIPTAPMYEWVVLKCGEPPYNRCSIAQKQPSPHYTPSGYSYLAEMLLDFITNLANRDENDITSKNQAQAPNVEEMSKMNEVRVHVTAN